MSFELGLLPSGHLHSFAAPEAEVAPPARDPQALREAFDRDAAEGLFTLAADKSTQGLGPSLHYWHGIAADYLSARCLLLEGAAAEAADRGDPAPPVAPLTAEAAERWVQCAPPMPGAEYLDAEVIQAIWEQLDAWVRQAIRAQGSLAALLNERASQWHPLGRVCFHLAENKRDPDYPFAFLATYAPAQQGGGQVRYQPLGRALQEYAGARDRQALIRLLSPVQRAAELSPRIKELVDSGDIYHPLAWTPREAYGFLREVPLYEQSGLVVRLPDWWRRRSRPQVAVRIGDSRQERFGREALLDFRVEAVLGDESLSEREAR